MSRITVSLVLIIPTPNFFMRKAAISLTPSAAISAFSTVFIPLDKYLKSIESATLVPSSLKAAIT